MIYKNGNATVSINEVGRREVEWPDNEELLLDYPLSIDLNISNRCSNGCAYCYAGNTPTGKMADLLSMTYLDDMLAGSEIAINIQYPLPENFEFWLEKMKKQGVIVNGTINQLDFERDSSIIDQIADWQSRELLHGIGISYRANNFVYDNISSLKNVVIHMIAGIHTLEEIQTMLKNYNVLVLGYKFTARGSDFALCFNSKVHSNLDILRGQVDELINSSGRGVLCFDTKALEQLDLKSHLSKEDWNRYYQGDEGTISFYVDGVEGTFNTDSYTCDAPFLIEGNSIKDMFKSIRGKVVHYENN